MQQQKQKQPKPSESEESVQGPVKQQQNDQKMVKNDDDNSLLSVNQFPQKLTVSNERIPKKKTQSIGQSGWQNLERAQRSRKPTQKMQQTQEINQRIKKLCEPNTKEKIQQFQKKYISNIKFQRYEIQNNFEYEIIANQIYGKGVSWAIELDKLKIKAIAICYVKLKKIFQNKDENQIKDINALIDQKQKQIRSRILQIVLSSINEVIEKHKQKVKEQILNFIIWHFLQNFQMLLSNNPVQYAEDIKKQQKNYILFSILAKEQFTAYVTYLEINLPPVFETYLLFMVGQIYNKIQKRHPKKKQQQLKQGQFFDIFQMFIQFQPETSYFLDFVASCSFIYEDEQQKQSIQQIQKFIKDSKFLHHFYFQFFKKYSIQVKKIKTAEKQNYDFTDMKSVQIIKEEMSNFTILYVDGLHKHIHGLTSPHQVDIQQNGKQKKQYIIYINTILFSSRYRKDKQLIRSHVAMTLVHQISHFLIRKLGYFKNIKNEVRRSLPKSISQQCRKLCNYKEGTQFDTGGFLECFLIGYKIEGITGKQFQALRIQSQNFQQQNKQQKQNSYQSSLSKLQSQFKKIKNQFQKQYQKSEIFGHGEPFCYKEIIAKRIGQSDDPEYPISYRQRICVVNGVRRDRLFYAIEKQEKSGESFESILKQ